MPSGVSLEGPGDDTPPSLTLWHRLLPRLSRSSSGQPKPRLADRLRDAALKPEDPDKAARSRGAYDLTGEELEIEAKQANDKERAIGIFVGPLATLIAFLVIHDLVVNDPPARINGVIDKLHVNPSSYYDLFAVLIVLSVLMTVMALWRKRLYLGLVIAMYGLAIFDLHYWGFGVPFVMVGAWYLVRAYRLQRNLKYSTGETSVTARPASNKRYKNKRYTPPPVAQKPGASAKSRRQRSRLN
jgi:hypothetical protein